MSSQVHPHTFIFSLYGGYVLPRGGEIWIGSLIRALAALNFSPGAVRTLVSRMQRQGLLQSQRQGRRSFYRLTDQGVKEVSWGSSRAFTPPEEEWDERWTVVSYSIPEKHRKRRDELRRLLNAFGFGALAPGVWISPYPLSPKAERKWRKVGVWQYLEVFRAEHLGPSTLDALVAQAWPQLSALANRYQRYIAEYEPVLRRFGTGILDDEQCFAARFQSLIDLVHITLEDPALHPIFLPEDWPRPFAQSLYLELRRELAEPAERFFDTIYETRKEASST